jgi:serine/threonine-protein kinase
VPWLVRLTYNPIVEESARTFVDSLIGERIGGRYVVERVLRAGGMGVVAAARYPELEQDVAIKFMRPELAANPVLSARFLREARLAARVKSPHFVHIFDFGRLDSGVPYLVMEMLHGCDLREELENRGPLPVEEAVDAILQAAVAIAELHALGIVHRDLKPSNLFIAQSGGRRTIKVLDFGVSKEAAQDKSELTLTGSMIGTPQYMSPEQIRESRTVDLRSDVWSLGVILYEMLTTMTPFGNGTEAAGEVCGMILYTDPTPLRARRSQLPAALETALNKCLRREIDERYATVLELAEALRPFAPAMSTHRIDEVFQVHSHPRLLALPEDDSLRAMTRTPTSKSSLEAKQAATLSTVSGPEVIIPEGAARPGETSMASVPSSARPPGREPARRAGLLGVLALMAVVMGLVLAARRIRTNPPAVPATGAQPVTIAEPPPSSAPIAVTAAPVAPVAPEPRPVSEPPADAARAAKKVAAPSPAMGYVSIDTYPWSRVSIDGRAVGETPLVALPVKPGTHAFVFENPETGLKETRSLTIGPNERVSKRFAFE